MEEFITLNQLKAIDKLKCPPIIYVEELPETFENCLYGIKHLDKETHEYLTRFTDILASYFTEVSKGKWTIKENYEVQVTDEMPFKSAALVDGKYHIYSEPDWTGMYPNSYSPYGDYPFIVSEIIEHTDYFAGNKEENTSVKIANVEEVERYFVRKDSKGKPNGVASLDANGRVPVEQMPVQAFVYLGQWDASTGVYPPDADTPGDFYEVSVPGIIEEVEFLKGDWIVWSSDGWHKSENKNYVTEVNKKRGVVEVYGDNTEIETPSDTEETDTRTIKQYIDDQDRDSVIEVKELPANPEYNKVYNLYEDLKEYKIEVRLHGEDYVGEVDLPGTSEFKIEFEGTEYLIEPKDEATLIIGTEESIPRFGYYKTINNTTKFVYVSDKEEDKTFTTNNKDTARVFSKDVEVVTKNYLEANKPVVDSEDDPRWENWPDNYIYLNKQGASGNLIITKNMEAGNNFFALVFFDDSVFDSLKYSLNGKDEVDFSKIPVQTIDSSEFKTFNVEIGEDFDPRATDDNAAFLIKMYHESTGKSDYVLYIYNYSGTDLLINKFTSNFEGQLVNSLDGNNLDNFLANDSMKLLNCTVIDEDTKEVLEAFPLSQDYESEYVKYTVESGNVIEKSWDTSVSASIQNYEKEENGAVFAKDVRLVTYQDFEDEKYLVHELGGTNIKVTYEGEKDTINNTLKKVGSIKQVDYQNPEEKNVVSRAVIDLPDVHQADFDGKDKVFRTKDEKGNTEVYAKDTKLVTDDEFNKKAVKSVNTIKPDEDGDVRTVVELTKQEYLALVEAEEDDPEVVYYVTNEGSSAEFINDLQISESTTWSSSKIRDAISAATPVTFDDTQVSTKLGWTSSKINKEIPKIDDTSVSTTKIYSSSKVEAIKSEIEGKGYLIKDDGTPDSNKGWSSQKVNTEISNATTDMATKSWVGENYQPKGSYVVPSEISDMETKTNASNTYQVKGDYATTDDISDMETKTHASQTYEPKNSDLATKTWVEEQGYSKGEIPEGVITTSNFLTELKKYIYVSDGNIIVNL